MRANTIISQLTNENHIIKVKYNELFQQYTELEKKLTEMESIWGHCSQPPLVLSPSISIDYNAIIESLQCKILELNKQIIQQNKCF